MSPDNLPQDIIPKLRQGGTISLSSKEREWLLEKLLLIVELQQVKRQCQELETKLGFPPSEEHKSQKRR